jgi:glycerate kinase
MTGKFWNRMVQLPRRAFDRLCGRGPAPPGGRARVDEAAKEEIEAAVAELRSALQRFGRVVEHSVEAAPPASSPEPGPGAAGGGQAP